MHFWVGFEKAAEEEATEKAKPKWVLPTAAGAAGLAAGAYLGYKGYKGQLKKLQRYGGSATGRLAKKGFGHDNAKPLSFISRYQTDTKHFDRAGGVFDHLSGKDLSDDYHAKRISIPDFYEGYKRNSFSPAHDAHLYQNPDGTYTSETVQYFAAKPNSQDKRHHFMHALVNWNKKPSPAAIERTRWQVREDYAKTKYHD